MERKNTNLFFLSGIFLLFTLLLVGRSYKDQTIKQNKSQARSTQKPSNANATPSWFKNVSIDNIGSTANR